MPGVLVATFLASKDPEMAKNPKNEKRMVRNLELIKYSFFLHTTNDRDGSATNGIQLKKNEGKGLQFLTQF